MDDKGVQGLNLPPVGNENPGNKISAVQSKFTSHFEQKQRKTAPKQSCREILYDGRNNKLLNVRVNLRGNWPKKTPKLPSGKKKNALKYYTLSGKEIKHNEKDQNDNCTFVSLDVYGKKAPL